MKRQTVVFPLTAFKFDFSFHKFKPYAKFTIFIMGACHPDNHCLFCFVNICLFQTIDELETVVDPVHCL